MLGTLAAPRCRLVAAASLLSAMSYRLRGLKRSSEGLLAVLLAYPPPLMMVMEAPSRSLGVCFLLCFGGSLRAQNRAPQLGIVSENPKVE